MHFHEKTCNESTIFIENHWVRGPFLGKSLNTKEIKTISCYVTSGCLILFKILLIDSPMALNQSKYLNIP